MLSRLLLGPVCTLVLSLAALAGDTTPMPQIPREDMAQLKEKMSALAERIAEEGFQTHLDYSVESNKQVEHILGVLHDEYKRTKSDEGYHGIALEFGAYIVKVVERHYGDVKWERDDPHFGSDSFPLQWRGLTLYPVGWCEKRLFDGPGDDVWMRFHTYVIDRASKTK